MYTPETKAKRMKAALAKEQHHLDKAARLAKEREAALAVAAEWRVQWEWLNNMPTTGVAAVEPPEGTDQ